MPTRTPSDPYWNIRTEPDSPARDAFEIKTGTYDSNLTFATRGLYIGAGGNVHVRMMGGANNITAPGGNASFIGVVTGTILPIRIDIVWSDTTTATELVGLY